MMVRSRSHSNRHAEGHTHLSFESAGASSWLTRKSVAIETTNSSPDTKRRCCPMDSPLTLAY